MVKDAVTVSTEGRFYTKYATASQPLSHLSPVGEIIADLTQDSKGWTHPVFALITGYTNNDWKLALCQAGLPSMESILITPIFPSVAGNQMAIAGVHALEIRSYLTETVCAHR